MNDWDTVTVIGNRRGAAGGSANKVPFFLGAQLPNDCPSARENNVSNLRTIKCYFTNLQIEVDLKWFLLHVL